MISVPELTAQQLEDFKRDGLVIMRQALDVNQTELMKQWATEMENMPEQSGRHWVYHEKSKFDDNKELISRIEYIFPFHQGFAELNKALKTPVSQLLGEEAVLFKEKINFKMPGGDGFKPHQDSQAGWSKYAKYFVSVMVSIDEATIENGCLQLVAGHQHDGLYKEWEPLTDEDMADMDFKYYPTNPGDIVLFDCYTPHASEPNMSKKTRRVYFATFNRFSEGNNLSQYYADKHKSYPPDIDRIPGKEYVFRV